VLDAVARDVLRLEKLHQRRGHVKRNEFAHGEGEGRGGGVQPC
jgi:hypothetical protein